MTVAAQHTWAAWSISCKALPSLGLSKALCLAPASLGEAFAVQPDDDPAVGQQGVVQLKLLDILEPAVGHADMSETQLASSMTGS